VIAIAMEAIDSVLQRNWSPMARVLSRLLFYDPEPK
jgi:hypothetical protein